MHETILTRTAIRERIAHFQSGTLTGKALAAWAFKQFADQEEELLQYEPDHEEVIAEVLDDLMWSDTAQFALDAATAQALAERLQ